jgi:DNA-binding NarL/FixJ family response regulator
MTVFLVEDSPLLRQRVEAILASIPGATSAGHAAGAAEAIAAIARVRPDTVVLDVHLENGTGFDVLRALRESGSAARVYVLTNFANEAYRRKAASLGAAGFFDKTTEFERLREALVGIVRP